VVAAPVFRAIAEAVLKRLGVEPPPVPVEMAALPPRPAKQPERAARTRAHQPGAAATVAVAAAVPDQDAIPSFLGLSLREAVTRARAAGWNVGVTGVGYVSEQYPPPGTPLATERRLDLRLAPGAVTASP
jgi:PASTA domain